jgi:hypothetical protein
VVIFLQKVAMGTLCIAYGTDSTIARRTRMNTIHSVLLSWISNRKDGGKGDPLGVELHQNGLSFAYCSSDEMVELALYRGALICENGGLFTVKAGFIPEIFPEEQLNRLADCLRFAAEEAGYDRSGITVIKHSDSSRKTSYTVFPWDV